MPNPIGAAGVAIAKQVLGGNRQTPPKAGGESFSQRLWAIGGAYDTMARWWGQANEFFPSFTHVISVSVKGGPNADLRRVWYLTVSTVFGRYRNRARGLQGVTFEGTWDVTGKACAAIVSYNNNGLVDAIFQGADLQNENGTHIASGLDLIQRGPDQVTVGGSWPNFLISSAQARLGAVPTGFFGGGLPPIDYFTQFVRQAAVQQQKDNNFFSYVPNTGSDQYRFIVQRVCDETTPVQTAGLQRWCGYRFNLFQDMQKLRGNVVSLPWARTIFIGSQSVNSESGSLQDNSTGRIPLLPDDGRLITAGVKLDPRHQPPKPVADGISRNGLLSLVSAALSKPCFLPKTPPCTAVPVFTAGIYVYAPGGGLGIDADNNLQLFIDATDQLLYSDNVAAAYNNTVPSACTLGPDGYPMPATTGTSVVNIQTYRTP